MKKIITATMALILFPPLQCVAGSKNDYAAAKNKDGWNPISIQNRANTDVAYIMDGMYGGAPYGIKKDESDVYHSGFGDKYAKFEVGICKHVNRSGDPCPIFESMHDCGNGAHYNADLIKTIYINSLTSCTIICTDGSSTSCKQSG